MYFSQGIMSGLLTEDLRYKDKYGKQPNVLGWKMVRMISKIDK